jgi:hypothetical protein
MMITIYEEAKLWVFVCGSAWSVFKAFSWILKIRTQDFKQVHANLAEIKESVHNQTTALRTDIEKQTYAIVSELKELRADLRVLRPMAVEPRMRLAKAARQKAKK